MSRSSRAAPRARLAPLLALAAALLAPTQGAAQSADPFALPKGTTIADAVEAEELGPGLSEIRVDGRTLKRMVELKWVDGALAIDAQSAATAQLPIPEGAAGFVKLDSLDLASWDFDRLAQRLTVKLFRKGDGPNDIDVARRNFMGGEHTPIFAALMDYDLTASVSGGETQVSAFAAPRITYGNFQLASDFHYISNRAKGGPSLVRLDTTATYGIANRNLQVSLGDVITAGAQSQRPLRIGGLQIGTDFALRPDLITAPLPDFYGTVAVPTSLDIIINDQRFKSADIEAGDYQVRNIPAVIGRGEVAVVVRDETGREVVQSARVYVSRDMLAPDLWEGAANVGWIRRRFGERSNDYDTLVGTFFLRRGLSRSLSLGVSGEIGAGVTNFGGQIDATVFDRAMVFSEVRFSRTPENSGFLVRSGVESAGEDFSVRVDAIWPSKGYRDIAAQTGDPLPPRQVNGSISFDLRETLRFQLTASSQWQPEDPRFDRDAQRIDLVRGSFRMPITDRIDLSTDLGYRRDRFGGSLSASLGVSMRFGGRHSAQASVTHQSKRTYGQASVYHMDIEPGDFGYGARAYIGERPAGSAMVAYRSRFNRVSAEADYFGGTVNLRANATGTLIFADNALFARNRTEGTYALVRTGTVGGVTVTRENRNAGMTDGHGRLLVENVTPLVPMQFDIDPDLLPVDAVAKATYKRVIVSRGGVSLVDLDVTAHRSQLIRLVDALGQPLPAGTRVVAGPSDTSYMVAFDGLVDFNVLSGDETLAIEPQGGGRCEIALPEFGADNFDTEELAAGCLKGSIAALD